MSLICVNKLRVNVLCVVMLIPIMLSVAMLSQIILIVVILGADMLNFPVSEKAVTTVAVVVLVPWKLRH